MIAHHALKKILAAEAQGDIAPTGAGAGGGAAEGDDAKTGAEAPDDQADDDALPVIIAGVAAMALLGVAALAVRRRA